MKVLITGASGLLGPYLVEAFKHNHEVEAVNREQCDLRDPTAVESLLERVKPDVVIHGAALTDVNECQSQPMKAYKLNVGSTYNLIHYLPPDKLMVYISSDMVYGTHFGPHAESAPNPLNVYGRTKLVGELCVADTPRHLIIRTNFFGPSMVPWRQSFSDWVIQSLTEGRTEVFYMDVWWSPLHMKTLSAVIHDLVERDVTGTYNLGSRDGMSKAEFAKAVADHLGLDFSKAAIGPAYFKTPRPHDMRLDCSKLANIGLVMPTLKEEIAKL